MEPEWGGGGACGCMQGGFGGGGCVCLCALYLEVHVQVIVVNLREEEGIVKVLRAALKWEAWGAVWRGTVRGVWLCVICGCV